MGLIRILLALAVVLAHIDNVTNGKGFWGFSFMLIEAKQAVLVFFMISGFYMGIILNEKYVGPQSYATYIKNRFLRIYPLYWFILLLTITTNIFFSEILSINEFNVGLDNYLLRLSECRFQDQVMLILSNISCIGLEYNFLCRTCNLPSFNIFNLPNETLIIGVAWSLGVETSFYLIAPFLVRLNNQIIVFIAIASFSLYVFFEFNFNKDYFSIPYWAFKAFLPAQLCFFLGGVLSYKIYCHIRSIKLHPRNYKFITSITLLYLILWPIIPFKFELLQNLVKGYFIFLLMFITIPFIFDFTKNNKWDRNLGEFSYPLYLIHIFFLSISKSFINIEYVGIVTLALSLISSGLLIKYFVEPIEKLRQRSLIVINKIS